MNESSQTDVIVESRGTITKFNKGHTRSSHTRPIPSVNINARMQDQNFRINNQRYFKKSVILLLKCYNQRPENIDQLVTYTNIKIKEFCQHNKICISTVSASTCLYCRGSHNIENCYFIPSLDTFRFRTKENAI